MNYLNEAEKLEQLAKKDGLDKKIENELKQKAEQYRQKHEQQKSNQ